MAKRPVIYYAITLEQGENWNARRPMREQEHWDEHAGLMDALVDDGFIVLGGPLNDGEKALLIINAASKPAKPDLQTIPDITGGAAHRKRRALGNPPGGESLTL
ncbi:MAG TPA: hypothetical protein VGD98_09285 [Ktedonobacteraceae bacterium]